tara:strand:+ start:16870 stop:17280 length:411 start_codon:yes stop_codon:yes gene_type:complete
MNRISLNRTNQEALEFEGELLLQEPGNDADGSSGGRWHDISVYREAGEDMVIAVAYRTQCSTESALIHAERADDVNDADSVLSLYEATEGIDRQSLNEMPENSRKRLLERVVSRYDLQVNSVLVQLEAIMAACQSR